MQNYENFSNAAEVPPDPPPYSEKQPYYEEGGAFPWHPAPSAPPPPPPMYPQAYPTQYGTGFGQVFAPQQGLYAVAAAPLGPKKDYLAFSIFSMFCFLPLGIAALVYSRKVSPCALGRQMGPSAPASWVGIVVRDLLEARVRERHCSRKQRSRRRVAFELPLTLTWDGDRGKGRGEI